MSAPAAPPPRPRILVLSPYSLHPMVHGGAVRICNLLRRLAADFDVYLLIFIGGSDDPEQRRALEPFCRRVFFQQLPARVAGDARRPRLPPEAACFAGPRVRERIAALVLAHDVDVLMLEYAELGQYADLGGLDGGTGVKVVLVEHDLAFRSQARRRAAGIAGGGRDRAAVERWRRYEVAACRRADQVHVMSEADRRELAAALAREAPQAASRLRVVPNGVDTGWYRPGDAAARRDLLFVGSFPHRPNLDALDTFLAETWPEIRHRRPETRLTVAGAQPPPRVLALDGRDGVRVAGEVADLRPLYAGHRALVVPLRAGSGTRLKILEAFAGGLPVVSTTIGAEGIEAVAGEDLLLADTPAEMAAVVVRLLDDDALVAALGARGRRLAERLYDWDAVYRRLRAALDELLSGPPRSAAAPAPPASGAAPEVSVILWGERQDRGVEERLRAVSEQRLERSCEVLWITPAPTAAAEEVALAAGVRMIVAAEVNRGRLLDRAAAAARGQVLVFLGPGTLPVNDAWLDNLTAPFFYDVAPAAVQGGVHERFKHGAPQLTLRFTRESRRWAGRYGFAFSLTNAAIRRDVWESFPFCADPILADRRWQRLVTAAGQLILPCWAAVVYRDRTIALRRFLRRTWEEGRAWRRLGERYSVWDLIADLWSPRAYAGDVTRADLTERARQERSRAERYFPWLRPLALFAGNRWPGWGQAKGSQGTTGPAAADGR